MKESSLLVLKVTELAGLDDLSLLNDDDPGAFLDSSESVCDNNGRSSLHDIVERLLHHPLRFLIECTRSLIENQNVGLPDDCSGNRDSLLLPTRQLASLDSAVYFVPVAQLLIIVRLVIPVIHLSLH